jgi:hypothetical protein
MSWTAVAIAGAAVVGGVASNQASKRQAGAANDATGAQLAMFDQTQANLQPWMQGGQAARMRLSDLMGMDSSPRLTSVGDAGTTFNPALINDPEYYNAWQDIFGGPNQGRSDKWSEEDLSRQIRDRLPASYLKKLSGPSSPDSGMLMKPFGMEDFKESPAYQFNLQQGQKAIEKAAAKRGTYYAPSTLQDISKFSQGMASNEFNNAYGQYNQNMKNIWDRLYSLSGSGQNAAANVGGFGTTVAGQVGENMIGAGNAQAAGTVGGANALTGGVNNYLNYSMMQQMLQGQQQSSVRGNSSLTGAGDLNQYLG